MLNNLNREFNSWDLIELGALRVLSKLTELFLIFSTIDFEHIKETSPIFGPMYYTAYTIYMMFIVFNVFLAIICEAIDGDYEEEFVKQAGDIQIGDYMMRQLKDILGIANDDDRLIEADGEDLPEHKFDVMNQKMLELECIVDRLVFSVDALDENTSTSVDDTTKTSDDVVSIIDDNHHRESQETILTEVIVYSNNNDNLRPVSSMSKVSEICL